MVVQFVADESYDDESFIVGCHAAKVEDWKSFSREWKHAIDSCGAISPDGARYFHANEMSTRCEEWLPYLSSIVGSTVGGGMVVRFKKLSIDRAQDRISIPGLKLEKVSSESMMYSIGWNGLMKLVATIFKNPDLDIFKGGMEFIFDDCSNSKRLIESWDGEPTPNSFKCVFPSAPIFKDDKEFLPLQAADLLAWCVRVADKNGDNRQELAKKALSSESYARLVLEVTEEDICKNIMQSIAAKIPSDYFVIDKFSDCCVQGFA